MLSTPDTRHSSKDAISPDLFARLYKSACETDDRDLRLQRCFVILLAGRLGLRATEILHIREEWINWKRGEICIPEFDPCSCKRCWEQAMNRWGRDGVRELTDEDSDYDYEERVGDPDKQWSRLVKEQQATVVEDAEICTTDRLVSYVYHDQFTPKYDKSARVIPFGWSDRLCAVISAFFDDHDYFDRSYETLRRWVDEVAENANGLDADKITPHTLRATGETFFADIAAHPKLLRDLAGWQSIETSRKYLAQSGRVNTKRVYELMGADEEDVPPVLPEDPAHAFPVVNNPTPFQNEPVEPINGPDYDREWRNEKHNEKHDETMVIFHPREDNKPWDSKPFPDQDELTYDGREHDLPGSIDRDDHPGLYELGHIETPATTLYEFIEPPRTSRESGEDSEKLFSETRQEEISEEPSTEQLTWGGGDSSKNKAADVAVVAVSSIFRMVGWAETRLRHLWNAYIDIGFLSEIDSFGKRVLIGIFGVVFLQALLTLILLDTGFAIEPTTLTIRWTRTHVAAFMLSGYILYSSRFFISDRD